MSLQLPGDIQSSINAFMFGNEYANEADVLRDALAALQREKDLAAIKEGIADYEAGRYRLWSEVKAELAARRPHEQT